MSYEAIGGIYIKFMHIVFEDFVGLFFELDDLIDVRLKLSRNREFWEVLQA